MTSHVFVIDSSARRQQVKTTPSTYLRDVLEEACTKFGKDPEQFVLTDSSRPPKLVDLSLTLRLSGLVNGAKLQLVQASRSPSVINVALKLPSSINEGQRLQDKFPSNTSLWLVLRRFEEAVAGGVSQKLNLTQRGVPSTQSGAGRLEYEQPVVKIMQREMADFVGLQKTLAQLGFNNGSVLLQLEFRTTGIPMEQAVAQISQYFDAPARSTAVEQTGPASESQLPGPSAPSGAHASSVADMTSVPDADAVETATPDDSKLDAAPSEDLQMPDAPPAPSDIHPAEEPALVASSTVTPQQPASEQEATISESSSSQDDTNPTGSDSGISVYKPPSASMPQAALQSTSESDFLPTIEHAHAHQAVLNRAAQNQRLPSNAEAAAESARRQEALLSIRSSAVRVRFPDQMQVDLTVDADATAASLHARVRDMLRDPELAFELRFTGAKGAPVTLAKEGPDAEKKLIRGLGWKGRVLVTMVWAAEVPLDSRTQVLKDSLVGQAREISVPVPQTGVQQGVGAAAGRVLDKNKEQAKGGNKADLEAKMKKFLGFGKGKK